MDTRTSSTSNASASDSRSENSQQPWLKIASATVAGIVATWGAYTFLSTRREEQRTPGTLTCSMSSMASSNVSSVQDVDMNTLTPDSKYLSDSEEDQLDGDDDDNDDKPIESAVPPALRRSFSSGFQACLHTVCEFEPKHSPKSEAADKNPAAVLDAQQFLTMDSEIGMLMRSVSAYQVMLDRSRIHYVADTESAEQLLQRIWQEEPRLLVIGLDAEWKPVKGSQVGMVQITTRFHTVLFHVAYMDRFPPTLQEILSSRQIYKVGVGVYGDARRIAADFGVIVRGCVELFPVLSRLTFGDDEPECGRSLRAVVSHVLGPLCDLPKDKRLTCSDWETSEITVAQTLYGAADAFFGRLAFVALFTEKQKVILERKMQASTHQNRHHNKHVGSAPTQTTTQLGVLPDAATLASLQDDGKGVWNSAHLGSLTQGLVDTRGTARPGKTSKASISNSVRTVHNATRKRAANVMRFLRGANTKKLYENCKMYSGGQLICCCDYDKLLWYLDRQLAVLVAPNAIELQFKPKGRGNADDPFYTQSHDNRCVVCGDKSSGFRKFNVVPHAYRKSFPDHTKSHSSHDVVLLCPACHLGTTNTYSKMFKTISEETGVPLDRGLCDADQKKYVRSDDERRRHVARSAASALLRMIRSTERGKRKRISIPEARQIELWDAVCDFLNKNSREQISTRDLELLSDLSLRSRPKASETHFARVVKLMKTDEELDEFCIRFRQFFVDEMKPKHLHPHWSVTHKKVP
jgi:exonuclease 3'-5' domain-containing protein 2